MYERPNNRSDVRQTFFDIFLFCAAILLILVAVDYSDVRLWLGPAVGLLREHIVAVIVTAAVILAVKLLSYEPSVRWR